MQKTSDINVVETSVLPSPAQLVAELPKTESQATFVARARDEIHRLIFTDDQRFLLVVGPCSIHDTAAGTEYAQKLAKLASEVSDRIMIVMRVYFEKPRTTVAPPALFCATSSTSDCPLPLNCSIRLHRSISPT